MQMFRLTCPDGLEKTVSADTKEVALSLLCDDPDMQSHFKSHHPELVHPSKEDMMRMMSPFVQPTL